MSTGSPRSVVARQVKTTVVSLPALLLLSGCVSPRIQTGGRLSPGSTVQVTVGGEIPFVQITNRGPGSIEVTWPATAAGGGGAERVIAGSVGRSIRGGGVVLLRMKSGEEARFKIDAQRASALDWVVLPGGDKPQSP